MERGVSQERHVARIVSEAGGGKVLISEVIDHPTTKDLAMFPFVDGDFTMRRQDEGGFDYFARIVTRERDQVPQELLAEIKPE